ncbi:hypothetical protein DENSPDRAFT_507360 [Dentipellis sp. KUC8613]|nr:hypothetical protein DENSPDRAFT_507360 [Dentipellis sp. KUC8613]
MPYSRPFAHGCATALHSPALATRGPEDAPRRHRSTKPTCKNSWKRTRQPGQAQRDAHVGRQPPHARGRVSCPPRHVARALTRVRVPQSWDCAASLRWNLRTNAVRTVLACRPHPEKPPVCGPGGFHSGRALLLGLAVAGATVVRGLSAVLSLCGASVGLCVLCWAPFWFGGELAGAASSLMIDGAAGTTYGRLVSRRN